MTRRVSLAELADSGIQLRPAEAAAIVGEVCRRREAGTLRGVPPPGVVRLTADGEIAIEGPVTTGNDVARAAHLLNSLIAGFDAAPEYRASGAMRLVIMRALGTLDLPPYRSLAEFRHGLDRFITHDPYDTARALFLAWDRARATNELRISEPEAVTISDIRRARRATGLTLEDLSSMAEVPAVQLRDLEWGYMRSWGADVRGRAQLVRYARAAGLDEQLVVSIAWPMIEEAAADPVPPAAVPIAVTTAMVPAGPRQLTVIDPPAAHAQTPSARGTLRRVGWTAAAAAALLVALASALGAPWNPPRARAAVIDPSPSVQIAATGTGAAPVVVTAPPPATPSRADRQPPRRAPAPAKKRQTRNASFFDRELIRLVFR